MSCYQQGDKKREANLYDPRRQTYSFFKSAIFFSFVNAFVGFGWVAMGESIIKTRVFTFAILLFLDIGSLVFTYFNLKKIIIWFRHVTLSSGIFTLYAVLISFDALRKIMGSNTLSLAVLFFSLVVVSILGYRAYEKIWGETLPQNASSGKIDLKNGVYSLITAPAVYSFKNRVLKGAPAFIVGSGSYLLGMGVFLGMRLSRVADQKGDVYKSVLFGLCSILFALVTSWLFYQYRWVRDWQKENGRIMVTKYV